MRRFAWIFLAAILLPSLVLAALAIRSARDQQILLEHQQALLSQGITDALARDVRDQLDAVRESFIQATRQLLESGIPPDDLAENFSTSLRKTWTLSEIGFAVNLDGTIHSPKIQEGLLARTFRNENDRFLGNRESAPLFSKNFSNGLAQNVFSSNSLSYQPPQVNQNGNLSQTQRQVIPQNGILSEQAAFSNTLPEESDFRRAIGNETSGELARFLEDKLRLLIWYRPPGGSLVFGAQLDRTGLIQNLKGLIQAAPAGDTRYCAALLDDHGIPLALSREGFKTDWKHPFAATEIGDALPHWEAALYLMQPQMLNNQARTLQLTLGLIVLVLMTVILSGGWVIAADARRQARLAQQKTDFVSNVSHELKTPLTSIRMFADMLAEGRVTDTERQTSYLRIISAESARLTRLINNVLDFARMERGAPAGELRPCDLAKILQEVLSFCQPHLETAGILLSVEGDIPSLPILGDRDALAQILLNLLSNAEKYGGNEIIIRIRRDDTPPPSGCIDVLDRGPGVPPRQAAAIFEPFQRLHDSLDSGVSGSGLGLTLARRMAQAHGGNVTYSSRDGGGSCFTLKVPLHHPGKFS